MRERINITVHQAIKSDVDQLSMKLNISRSELISRIIELVVDKLNREDLHSFTVYVPSLLKSWRE